MKLTTSQTRLLVALAREGSRAVAASYLCQRLTGVPINKVGAAERSALQRDIVALRDAGLVAEFRSGDQEAFAITIRGRLDLRWGKRTWRCRFATLLGLGLHPVTGDGKAAPVRWHSTR